LLCSSLPLAGERPGERGRCSCSAPLSRWRERGRERGAVDLGFRVPQPSKAPSPKPSPEPLSPTPPPQAWEGLSKVQSPSPQPLPRKRGRGCQKSKAPLPNPSPASVGGALFCSSLPLAGERHGAQHHRHPTWFTQGAAGRRVMRKWSNQMLPMIDCSEGIRAGSLSHSHCA